MRYKKILFILTVLLIAAFSGQAFSATYTYDNLNRLRSVNYGDGNIAGYGYDAAGNRISMSVYSGLQGFANINSGAISTLSTSVTLSITAIDSLVGWAVPTI